MLVIIKSAPNTPEGRRGVKLARDMAADIMLIQNGVYFARKEQLEGFCGRAFMLEDDSRMRGLKNDVIDKDIRNIDYDGFVDLMTENNKVIGMF